MNRKFLFSVLGLLVLVGVFLFVMNGITVEAAGVDTMCFEFWQDDPGQYEIYIEPSHEQGYASEEACEVSCNEQACMGACEGFVYQSDTPECMQFNDGGDPPIYFDAWTCYCGFSSEQQ